jgi:nicotinate-nucleotide pyrophosphorylase (carboxylating)
VDGTLEVTVLRCDGDALAAGDAALEIFGEAGSILTAERVALNFLQRLSGVATLTRAYADVVNGTGVTLLDTRKTTPGFRALEKEAVLAGGASNLRMGLYDMVMVKDNHLAVGAGLDDLQSAIGAIRRDKPHVKIELEADTLDQVRAFYKLEGVDVILLDNMTVAQIKEAVAARPAGIRLEASGGVNLDTVRAIAETGVDFISIGALTHSAPSVDLSLDLDDR